MLKDLYLTLFGSLLPGTPFVRDVDYRSAILNILDSSKNGWTDNPPEESSNLESITQKWIDADKVIIDFSDRLWYKFYRVKSSKDQQLIINAAIRCLTDRIATHDAIIFQPSDHQQWLHTLLNYATLTHWLVAWRSMNYHWEQNETCKRAAAILTLLDDTEEAVKVKNKGVITSINDLLAVALFTPCLDLSCKNPADMQRAFNVIKGSMAGTVFARNTNPQQLKYSATHLILGKDCRIAYRPEKIEPGEWHLPLRPLLESIVERSLSELDAANNRIIDEALNIEFRYHQFKSFPDTPYNGKLIVGLDSIFKTFTSSPGLRVQHVHLMQIRHASECLCSFRIHAQPAYRPSPGQLIVVVVDGNYSLGKIQSVRNANGNEYLVTYELKTDSLHFDTCIEADANKPDTTGKEQPCIHFESSKNASNVRSTHIITEISRGLYPGPVPLACVQLKTSQTHLQFAETVDSGDGWVEQRFTIRKT
jgi:hypothetical protein